MSVWLFEDREWETEAACRAYPTEWFYGIEELPGKQRHRPSLTSKEIRRAKDVCDTCVVKQECFDYAMKIREPWGIWGGTTGKERQRMWLGK